jgi:hypothetical protein
MSMNRREFLRAGAGSAVVASGLTAAGLGEPAEATRKRKPKHKRKPKAGPKPRIPSSYHDGAGRAHSRAYFGVHAASAIAGVSAPEALESALGRRVAIDHSFRQPPEAPWGPIRTRMLRDKAAGRIPMLSYAGGEKAGIANHDTASLARLREIASGARDAQIDGQAKALAALRTPVFLRFTWEFDLRYAGPVGVRVHKAAWRHVWKRFQAMGASNVAFVWCPSWLAFTNGRAAAYYPGDGYVDWIGADGYARNPDYRSFARLFDPAHTFSRARGKPFMVCETGVSRVDAPAEQPAGERLAVTAQSAWLDAVRTNLSQDRYPNTKALLYFHVDGDDHPLPNQWRVTRPLDGPAFASFKALAFHPRLRATR